MQNAAIVRPTARPTATGWGIYGLHLAVKLPLFLGLLAARWPFVVIMWPKPNVLTRPIVRRAWRVVAALEALAARVAKSMPVCPE